MLGLLVVIVKIPAGCAGDRTHGQSNAGVVRVRPNNPTGCGADGSAAQGALFGKRNKLGHGFARIFADNSFCIFRYPVNLRSFMSQNI